MVVFYLSGVTYKDLGSGMLFKREN